MRASVVHLILAMVWGVLLVPILLWWYDSLLVVLLISVYANIGSHLAAFQGAHAEERIVKRVEEAIHKGKCRLGDPEHDPDVARLLDQIAQLEEELRTLKGRIQV